MADHEDKKSLAQRSGQIFSPLNNIALVLIVAAIIAALLS